MRSSICVPRCRDTSEDETRKAENYRVNGRQEATEHSNGMAEDVGKLSSHQGK